MINLLSAALQTELDNFFKIIEKSDVAIKRVTKSAFSQARRKLKYQAFIFLSAIILENFYRSNMTKKWNGFRLLAIDGTTFLLPPSTEIIKRFGVTKQSDKVSGYTLVRALQIYDPLNH